MDEQRKQQLKASANALAYLVYGMCNNMDGFESGIKAIEQVYGTIPISLPANFTNQEPVVAVKPSIDHQQRNAPSDVDNNKENDVILHSEPTLELPMTLEIDEEKEQKTSSPNSSHSKRGGNSE